MKHKIKITNGEIKYKVSGHNADRLVFRAICNNLMTNSHGDR